MPALPDLSGTLPLVELQHQFVREVLYRDSAGLAAQVVENGRSAEQRLGVYRNNAREGFALALEAAFPVLLAAMGSKTFRELAWAYQRACPSPAGNLFHIGKRLPGFLDDHVRGTGDEHLIDIAGLEWAVQESLVAADQDTPLDLAMLATVPVDRHGELHFQLHPSVRLLQTEYGVFDLWEAHQVRGPVVRAEQSPENLLIRRLAAGVQLQRLSVPDAVWLEALSRGGSLAESTAVLPGIASGELGELLVRWVTAGVVTAYTLNGQSARGPLS